MNKAAKKANSVLAKIRLYFGLRPHGGKNILDVDIEFHKDAAIYGSHGKINVSSKKDGLRDIPVHFVFVGLSTPPNLNSMVMDYIWEKAREKGFIAHSLAYYGTPLKSNVGLPARAMLSASRADAEDAIKVNKRVSILTQQAIQRQRLATAATTTAKDKAVTG